MSTPSLILVPARFKTGKLYTPLATTSGGVVLGASGDFNVTRATTATRVNASGLIESVASGVPRLDYYTSGGTAGCPALLVEPSAANGILNSQDTATSWLLGANLSSGYVDVIGVSGNNLTVAVSGSNIGAGAGRMQRPSNNVALASGSTYTISFLMKKTGTHTIGGYYALITGGAAGDLGGGFSVSGSFSSGSTYNSAGTTNRIRRVEQWGTDVYRCSETFTMTASGTLTAFNLAPLSGVSSASNPAVGLGIAFAAPQVELGAIPTSFIPTTTAAATRNADVVSVSGAVSGAIGQTEGTIYAEFRYLGRETTRAGIVYLRQTASRGFGISLVSNAISFISRNTSGTSSITLVNGLTFGTYYKIAIAYDANGTAAGGTEVSGVTAYVNGSPANVSVGDLRVPDATITEIRLYGAVSGSDTETANANIRAAALYTTRLTNAQLAALTT
jgi:hypothetical protein